MRTRTSFLALAMVAALAIAGCGDDNNDNDDNDNGGPVVTRTATPAPNPTQTPVATTVEPTATPVETGATEAPTPQPTATSSGTVCEGTALTTTVTSLAGSDLDTGWTGIAHDSVATREAKVTTNLDCADGVNCTVDGSALVGTTFGSPLPLSSGGVSSCVVNVFREAITGTYNCENGCAESSVKLTSRVFLVVNQEKPCPPCVGDATPNDGVKGGTCDGGTTPGAACDVGGISDLFQNAGGAPPDAGSTSNDCLPTGSPVGNLSIDLNPLTTDTISVDPDVNCLNSTFGATCHCPGQVQPNSCINPNGRCPVSGFCENNPPIGVCSGQKFRQCFLTSSPTADCEDISPGAGECQAQLQPCFGTTITRTGECGTQEGTLASIFCIPATQAAAINTVFGLPGPGVASIPVRLEAPVDTPPARFIDNGDGTVSDSGTGLQWEKKTTTVGSGPNFADPHDVDNSYTWSTGAPWNQDGTVFTDFLLKLNTPPCFAGHCDWRLPKGGGRPDLGNPSGEPAELESILLTPYPCLQPIPCIHPIFAPTTVSNYWSATTIATNAYGAWVVYFGNGYVAGNYKSESNYVRAVRGP